MSAPRVFRVDIGDGSSFPPAYGMEDDVLDILGRALTDGTATRSQQLMARSYIEAYVALVDCTRDRRERVVRCLRRDGGRR